MQNSLSSLISHRFHIKCTIWVKQKRDLIGTDSNNRQLWISYVGQFKEDAKLLKYFTRINNLFSSSISISFCIIIHCMRWRDTSTIINMHKVYLNTILCGIIFHFIEREKRKLNMHILWHCREVFGYNMQAKHSKAMNLFAFNLTSIYVSFEENVDLKKNFRMWPDGCCTLHSSMLWVMIIFFMQINEILKIFKYLNFNFIGFLKIILSNNPCMLIYAKSLFLGYCWQT